MKKAQLLYLIISIFFIACEGDEGPTGSQGSVGVNTLINMLVEKAGSNCENGGVKIETGLDNNFNGILDNNEVQNTKYVCNGLNGENSLTTTIKEPAGANCENGGVKINSGLDLNKNGLLDENEITSTTYVCNGNEGGIISEEVRLKISGANSSTSSKNPTYYFSGITFDITKYKNVNSITFESNPYVFYAPNVEHSNYALVELYNFTDNVPISNSLIRANSLPNDKIYLRTNELINEIPQKEIKLGIKLMSEIDGQSSVSGDSYIILKRIIN